MVLSSEAVITSFFPSAPATPHIASNILNKPLCGGHCNQPQSYFKNTGAAPPLSNKAPNRNQQVYKDSGAQVKKVSPERLLQASKNAAS